MKSKLAPIVAVLAVVGGGYFAYSQFKPSDDAGIDVVDEMKDQMEDAKDNLVSGTLMDFVSKGVPFKCSYSVEGSSFEGIIKGKNFLGKIKSQTGENGNVLMKENCRHTWEEGAIEGFTICFEDPEEDIWEQPSGMSSEYNCRPTVIADNAFDLPKDVTFMSLEDMMMNIENHTMG